MTKSCLGYSLNNKVFCRPCGEAALDAWWDDEGAVLDVVELHAESKDLSCARCGASLGEPADE